MIERPHIQTAIPQRRYRLGAFEATLLGDIESGDGVEYRYILAFVEEGRQKPALFVCCEENPPGARDQGRYRLRVVNDAMSEVLESGDEWRNLELFAQQALSIGSKALSLTDEQPIRMS